MMAQKRAGKSKVKPKTKTAARTTRKKTAKTQQVPARSRTASSRTRRRAVNGRTNALDLYRQVFRRGPLELARSLRQSIQRGRWRRTSVFKSAMSMFNVYANRAGRHLPASLRRGVHVYATRAGDRLPASFRRRVHRARQELRKVFYGQPSRA